MATSDPFGDLVEGYACIAAAPDLAVRRGWADYLAHRVPELEAQFPGIRDLIHARAKQLIKQFMAVVA